MQAINGYQQIFVHYTFANPRTLSAILLMFFDAELH